MSYFTAILTLNGRAERVSVCAATFAEAQTLLLHFQSGFMAASGQYPQLEGLNKVQRPRDAKDILAAAQLFTKE